MVDQFLIWELTMNREYGDPGSVYMFMDGNGKLSAGPVWDFDRGTFQNQEKATSLGNSTSYRVKPDDAWMFNRSQESDTYSYVWYRQLAKDETFRNTVVERWAQSPIPNPQSPIPIFYIFSFYNLFIVNK